MKLLIDENLTPDLVRVANEKGFEATSVRNIGMVGKPDHNLMVGIIENDWTIVTNNSKHIHTSQISKFPCCTDIDFSVGAPNLKQFDWLKHYTSALSYFNLKNGGFPRLPSLFHKSAIQCQLRA